MSSGASAASHLVVQFGGVMLGLRAELVERVEDHQTPRPLPQVPSHVVGVVALGEQTLPVMDPARFLELPAAPRDDHQRRIVVVAVSGMRVGLICDRVFGLRELESGTVTPAVLQGEALRRFVVEEHDLAGMRVARLDLPGMLQAARLARGGSA